MSRGEHLEKCGAQPFLRTDSDKEYCRAKTTDVLLFLQAASRWVRTSELVPINHRFSASIYELRLEGHDIQRRRHEDGEFEWKYIKRIAAFPATREWKEKYYQSSHWKDRRERRLNHDGFKCCNCHATSELKVHHWRYDLFEERLGDLMTLCTACHERMHDNVKIKFPQVIPEDIYYRLVPRPHAAKLAENGVLFDKDPFHLFD